MQRGLFGLVAVGDESSHQMHHEVERAAMAGMLNLADVLELIDDRLDDRALAQEQLVAEREQAVTHVAAQLGDQA